MLELGGGDLLGNTTSRVTPASDQRIGCSDHILVEESGCPDLAGNKCASEDTNEEADGIEAGSVVDRACESSGNGAEEQASDEDFSGAEFVAEGTRNEAEEEGGGEGDDV